MYSSWHKNVFKNIACVINVSPERQKLHVRVVNDTQNSQSSGWLKMTLCVMTLRYFPPLCFRQTHCQNDNWRLKWRLVRQKAGNYVTSWRTKLCWHVSTSLCVFRVCPAVRVAGVRPRVAAAAVSGSAAHHQRHAGLEVHTGRLPHLPPTLLPRRLHCRRHCTYIT